jgi:maltoporin
MNVAILSVLFLLLTGWMQQSCDTKEVALSREFKLKVGQEVLVKEAGIKVSLHAIVEDSRCPTGVQCIWAGNGKISVHLSKAKNEAVSVELNTSAGPRSSTYQGYDVKLVGLDPYPKDGVTIDKNAYVVTLMVCRNCGESDDGAQKGSVSQ